MLAKFCSLMRCPPTMIRAGSPGTKRTMKKTIDVIRNISGISVSSLVRINRATATAPRRRNPLRRSWSETQFRCRTVGLIQELTQDFPVSLGVFQFRMVATAREDFKPRSRDSLVERPGGRGMNLVKLTNGNQRRNRDFAQAIGAIPFQEISGA